MFLQILEARALFGLYGNLRLAAFGITRRNNCDVKIILIFSEF